MTLAILTAALLSMVLAWALGSCKPRHSVWLAAAAGVILTAALSWAWVASTAPLVDAQWLPGLGSRFTLAMDPLGAPLAIFAAGLSVVILLFTAGYMPHHLHEQRRPLMAQALFCGEMLVFVVAMVVLFVAQDLLLIFAALEATALASFLLIQFDRQKRQARRAALVALVVTAGSSLLFLTGVLLVARTAGTTVLADLGGRPEALPAFSLAGVFMVAGVLGKSAQVPPHFWLPRAMVAPTPVSAYLHSAALVAAGVFVISRLAPLWRASPWATDLLLVTGIASITLGSVQALVSDELKRILAYSTVAQYGYMVVLVALSKGNRPEEVMLMLVAHGLCKSALFLTAGTVTMVTGATKLSEIGGLRRRMPWLATASSVAAAGLAGLPLSVGYFKDEVFFAVVADRGVTAAVLGATAAGLTLAYTGRFWFGLFHGPQSGSAASRKEPSLLLVPISLLAGLVILGGIWTEPLRHVLAGAAQHPEGFTLKYHLSGPSFWMALTAWGTGVVILAGRRSPFAARLRGASAMRLIPPSLGRIREGVAETPCLVGAWTRALEHQLVRAPVLMVTLPCTILFLLAVAVDEGPTLRLELPSVDQWPSAVAISLSGTAAVLTATARSRIGLVLILSFVGFGLAVTFALSGAPNVALVLVVVETALTVLFLSLLWRTRPSVLAKANRGQASCSGARWAGSAGFLVAFGTALYSLERQSRRTVAQDLVALTDAAHQQDAVTAILSDFRGLDTAGELTVLAVAILGARSVAWGRS